MQKIVVDTNVLISALIGSSYPKMIFLDWIFTKKVDICLSSAVFNEYHEVLHRPKFAKYPNFIANADIVLNQLNQIAIFIEPQIRLDIIKDEADNRFLELAVSAKAQFLITGNTKHFTFTNYEQVTIISPEAFVKQMALQ